MNQLGTRLAGDKTMPWTSLRRTVCSAAAITAAALMVVGGSSAWGKTPSLSSLPRVFHEDFESGMDRWEATAPEAWRIERQRGGHVANQFKHNPAKPSVR